MNRTDWEHYGTHYDAEAAERLRRPNRPALDANHALFLRVEWLPEHQRQSWDTLADAGVHAYMVLCRKDTGELEHWVSKTRRCDNIWKNRNHPRFPWEIIIFIKIKK